MYSMKSPHKYTKRFCCLAEPLYMAANMVQLTLFLYGDILHQNWNNINPHPIRCFSMIPCFFNLWMTVATWIKSGIDSFLSRVKENSVLFCRQVLAGGEMELLRVLVANILSHIIRFWRRCHGGIGLYALIFLRAEGDRFSIAGADDRSLQIVPVHLHISITELA